ncbi:stability/partitioning determinant [Methylobacterium tarhaniae]|uniref:stability/partitioning determinant n=1 Tax=Methylobacterium tarhaniae TaxID=1187852 RepID=UPI003D07F4B4
MSTKERAPLGFGDELESFDPAAWSKPKDKPANDKPKPSVAKEAAEASGFKSREPVKAQPKPEAPAPAPAPKQQRRRRTGRNVQFNIKTKQEAIEAFTAIADAQGWGFGEAFERATELLQREHGAEKR